MCGPDRRFEHRQEWTRPTADRGQNQSSLMVDEHTEVNVLGVVRVGV